MSTMSKNRRPVAMVTPPPMARKPKYTSQQKESVLANFDLEVHDRTRNIRSQLDATLNTFLLKQDMEIMRIPRELKELTVGQIERFWDGNLADTVKRLKREVIERQEREREKEEEEEQRRKDEEGRKRKRGTGGTESPNRGSKNARKDTAPSSTTKTSAPSNKRKQPARTRQKVTHSNPPVSQGPSSLPQDHVFNPILPPTPSQPRYARPTDLLISANGSPILNPLPASPTHSHSPTPSHSDINSDSDLDLPDTEALEARLLAQSQSQPHRPKLASPKSKPSKSKAKRAPSLIFRQSLANNGNGNPIQQIQTNGNGNDGLLREFPLGDGRVVTFNPLALSPGRVDAEIDEGDFAEAEKVKLKTGVRDEVVRALQERMQIWKI